MTLDPLMLSFVAGVLATLACGLGALPVGSAALAGPRYRGISFSFAGGLMFAAAVYNLILPSLTLQQRQPEIAEASAVVAGILAGAAVMAGLDRWLHARVAQGTWEQWGGRTGLLVLLAMSVHSIPEGVAVGVGFASDVAHDAHLGVFIAVAIAIHNIPEGLTVAIPLRASGASLSRCFWAACLTSLPQPIAAVPASALALWITPLIPPLMGFAAGAMIFLVILEILPNALETSRPLTVAWSFTIGFCAMLALQVAL